MMRNRFVAISMKGYELFPVNKQIEMNVAGRYQPFNGPTFFNSIGSAQAVYGREREGEWRRVRGNSGLCGACCKCVIYDVPG